MFWFIGVWKFCVLGDRLFFFLGSFWYFFLFVARERRSLFFWGLILGVFLVVRFGWRD